MKRHGFRLRLRYKYVLTYGLVMLLPFSILLGMFMADRMDISQADAQKTYNFVLDQCADAMDARFSNLQEIAIRILTNEHLQPSNMRTVQGEIQALNNLRMHNAGNLLSSKVYLCLRKNGCVYNNEGKTDWDAFCRLMLGMDAQQAEQFREWLYQPTSCSQTILRFGHTSEYLGIRYATSKSSYAPVVFYLIPVSDIASQCRGLLGNAAEYMALMDLNGTVLVYPEKSEKESYLVNTTAFEREIDYSGLCLQLAVPNDLLNVSLFTAIPYLLSVIMTLLVVSLLFATWTALAVYRPIHVLYEQVPRKAEHQGELQAISDTLQQFRSENAALRQTVERQISCVGNYALERLFRGDTLQPEMTEMLKQGGLRQQWPWYQVIGFAFDEDLPSSERHTLQKRITDLLLHLPQKYTKVESIIQERPGQGLMIALLNMQERELAEMLFRDLCLLEGASVYVVLSQCREGIGQVHYAYNEALTSLSLMQMYRQPGIALGSEVLEEQSDDHPEALSRYEQQLLTAIRDGNPTISTDALKSITVIAANDGAPDVHRKLLHIFCQLLTRALEAPGDAVEEELSQVLADSSDTLKQFQQMNPLVTKLCMLAQQRMNEEQQMLRHDIAAFVAEHCYQQDFSLEMVADAFDMSVYTASRYFCTSTGERFKDLIARMRIDRAKELLTQTDWPVKEIVQSVGYSDVSTFIQKFKSSEGMTPGQYRSVHSKG